MAEHSEAPQAPRGLANVMLLTGVSVSVSLMLAGPCGLAGAVLTWVKGLVRTVSEPPSPGCNDPEGNTTQAKDNTSRSQEGRAVCRPPPQQALLKVQGTGGVQG